MMRELSLTAFGLLLFSNLAIAQIVDPSTHRGGYSGVGSIFTYSDGTPAAPTGQIYVKGTGDQSTPPQPWQAQGGAGADYAMDVLFPFHHHLVEIDAMSTGNGFLDSRNGEPSLEGRWGAVMISVSNESGNAPVTANGWLDARSQGAFGARTTPGGDLVTHYFDSEGGIDPILRGETFITQLAGQVGLQGDQDTDSLDVAMGVIASGSGLATSLFFTTQGQFFFSLSEQSAAALDGQRFALKKTGGIVEHPDPATIYKMYWFQMGNGTWRWSYPREHLTTADLGLSPTVDNVDALDVDVERDTVLFSTQPFPGRSQLLVWEGGPNPMVHTLKTPGNLTPVVTDAFYLEEYESGEDEGDDIDGVCIFDPEVDSYDNSLGTPVNGGPSSTLGLSVLRQEDGDYFCHVTGPVAGLGSGGGPNPGLAPSLKIYLSWDYQPSSEDPDSPLYTWVDVTPQPTYHVGQATGLSVGLPVHSYSAGKPLFFRAVITISGGTETSWVSALDL